MHVIVGLLLAALLAWLAYRFVFARTAGPAVVTSSARNQRPFAYLANGLLFFREAGGRMVQMQSAYAQEAQDRRERARERHGWKKGTAFGIAAGGGMRNLEQADEPVVATSAVYGADGALLYFLKHDTVGGLFRRDPVTGNEQRLLLKQGLHLADLAIAPDGKTLAASSHQQTGGGIANIVLTDAEGNALREVTAGDTLDTAPAWIPGVENRLLFQSAGLGRNQEGYVVALGHASIQKLDMASGSVTPILDDPRFDFLKPRVCPAGNLHFIRRPYEAPAYGARNVLVDTLLFPFRLLRAVFHYLNFFSLMYSRKPLTSAQGDMKADLKQILLQGKRVDAEKALRSARMVQGVPSLVPDSWELVRRDPEGREVVLATNVASYDIAPDGTIVYSNGRGVFVLERGGRCELAHTEDLVGEVVASAAQPA